jgi:hypothetical protein
MDKFEEFKGLSDNSDLMKEYEEEILSIADIVLATSKSLLEKVEDQTNNVHLVPNAAEVEHFMQAADGGLEIPAEVEGLEGPIAGFFGAIADWFDVELIAELADRNPETSIVLIGNVTIKVDALIEYDNIYLLGEKPYEKLNSPQVITGFEERDVLEGVYLLLCQIENSDSRVVNQYSRVVKKEGNKKIQEIIDEVFEIADGDWRGFGIIKNSGLEIRKKYQKFDAKNKYKNVLDKIDFSKSKDPVGCKCGEVIQGIISPKKCPMFGKVCTPDNPVGPCMVSVEGACNNLFCEAE